jgi:glutaredoxin 3
MTSITLYQFEDCPYCAKVRAKLAEMKLVYEEINVPRDREDPLRKEIAAKSGILTVPVIKIDNTYIGDSAAILVYLAQHF